MRRTVLSRALVCAIAVASCTAPSAADDGGTIEYFDGGSLRSDVRLSLGFLYGAGARPDGLGAPVSTVRSGIASTSGNPSGLSFIESSGLLIDALPPLGASVSDIANLESRARSMLDDALEDVAAVNLRPTYPTLEAFAGQQAGFISGAVALRFGQVVAGASIEEPMSLELSLVENGIEAFAGGVKDDGDDDVDIEMRGFADAACDLVFRVDRTTAAAGMKVASNVALGLSLSRYHARAAVDGMLRGDGVVDYGGQEYAFNDPSDLWENALGGSVAGSFGGDAYGWSVGASYRGLDWMTLDVLYVRVPRLTLAGRLTTIESMPEAATDGGLDLSEVSASQPTLTETTITVEDDPVGLLLPSYAGAAASFRLGPALTTLEYRLYSGTLGYEYQGHSEGVELGSGVGVEVGVGALWLGGGVIRGTLVGESASGDGSDDVWIPLANLGMGFGVGEHTSIDLLILALPLQVAKVSFAYEF
ncbi:MAG: hypothetical protein ABIG03_00620 [Candidatus Eisenbacteria bacterium]